MAFNLEQKNTEKRKNNIEKFLWFFKTIANSSQVLRSNSAGPTIRNDWCEADIQTIPWFKFLIGEFSLSLATIAGGKTFHGLLTEDVLWPRRKKK